MSLEVQNLVRRFGRATALDGASLDARPGEVVALLGPSGCGKTTTLRVIAGFEQADSGHVLLAGQDLSRLPPHRRDIGLVFQDYALFPHMSVADNVGYGLRRRGMAAAERQARVAAMLELVRLAGLEARRPAQLSGGQQQRVALARALAIAPRLLLLDEPLSNLDARLRGTLQLELRQILTQVGTTTLIVTHDQEEAMALADRIAIMHQGRVLQIGTPREVHDAPASRFVAEFLGRSVWLEGSYADGVFTTQAGTRLDCAPPRLRAARYGLLLRPHRLQVAEAGLPARVVGAQYRGHAMQVAMLVEGRVPAMLDWPHAVALPGTGQAVHLHVPRDEAVLVPED
jgi:putative spermidine/putrescine transport system ATP-binding protein